MSILDHPDHPCISTSSGEMEGYIVEMRVSIPGVIPRVIAGVHLSDKWVKLNPDKVLPGRGIPNGRPHTSYQLTMADLLSYPTAEALRWWAVAEAHSQCFDLETRLVKHRLTWSWSSEPQVAMKEVTAQELIKLVP